MILEEVMARPTPPYDQYQHGGRRQPASAATRGGGRRQPPPSSLSVRPGIYKSEFRQFVAQLVSVVGRVRRSWLPLLPRSAHTAPPAAAAIQTTHSCEFYIKKKEGLVPPSVLRERLFENLKSFVDIVADGLDDWTTDSCLQYRYVATRMA